MYRGHVNACNHAYIYIISFERLFSEPYHYITSYEYILTLPRPDVTGMMGNPPARTHEFSGGARWPEIFHAGDIIVDRL